MLSRRTTKFDTCHQIGHRGRATIEEISILTGAEHQFPLRRTARWHIDEISMIAVSTRLLVDLPGRRPYIVKLTTHVPARSIAHLGVGGTVGVVVNDRDPGRVAIDWLMEVTRPRAEECCPDRSICLAESERCDAPVA